MTTHCIDLPLTASQACRRPAGCVGLLGCGSRCSRGHSFRSTAPTACCLGCLLPSPAALPCLTSPRRAPPAPPQMMRQMEAEMDAMSRAFGMPSLLGPSLFDAVMPAPPAELPAVAPAARALAVDITDKGDALEIRADVPGMGKDDIKVQVSRGKNRKTGRRQRLTRLLLSATPNNPTSPTPPGRRSPPTAC